MANVTTSPLPQKTCPLPDSARQISQCAIDHLRRVIPPQSPSHIPARIYSDASPRASWGVTSNQFTLHFRFGWPFRLINTYRRGHRIPQSRSEFRPPLLLTPLWQAHTVAECQYSCLPSATLTVAAVSHQSVGPNV